ncbi:hypothetical protein GGI02_001155 [Coemansia sp. RSA 2322]|nr:hypothetical protein GGI02_001155 [Coemansia sp. RSA 2322]
MSTNEDEGENAFPTEQKSAEEDSFIADTPADTDTGTEAPQLSLKQIYGMLCWLQVGDNSKRWKEQPLEACKQAVTECPHLADTAASQLCQQMDMINSQREKIIAEHRKKDGSGDIASGSVGEGVRVYPGGPLFAIVDYALSGHCAASSSDVVKMQGTGGLLSNQQNAMSNGGVGPVRQPRQHSRFDPLLGSGDLVERARRLTPAEIRQMRDEVAIRREIATRDAVLLADWMALRRRELEAKEMRLRDLIRGNRDAGSMDALLRFESYIDSIHDDI